MDIDQIIIPNPNIAARLFSGKGYPATANFGLIFDRYLAIWDNARSFPERQGALSEPLEKFVKEFNRVGSDPSRIKMLEIVNNRRKESLDQGQYISEQYETMWHLVTGMGTDHPIENGFVFDPVLGVPILPGSGIKGLCRQAAKLIFDDEGVNDDRIVKLFGPEPEDNSSNLKQGRLIFYDAFPVNWPRLCVDIINCHNPYYYRQLELFNPLELSNPSSTPTVDVTESPIPVFFIALDKGVRFNFFVGIKHSGDGDGIEGDVKDILDLALTKIGFGAKTAAGYGVMEKVSGETDDQIDIHTEQVSWLNTAIQELMEELKTNRREEILRGKRLAEKWQTLPDGPEKEQALKEIKLQWDKKGWRQNPKGKALKTAFKIYSDSGLF
ncbi:MAG: type III-B CRISPR module RAMP protein Cmr6 [Nitrospiraceae bacterium]|nr:type III-B CRISPR module RAMP protein Cmr6 [Nitrospiraceae bacterium]